MKSCLCRYSMSVVAFVSFLCVGLSTNTHAQVQVPTKIVTIYNDTKDTTMYPVLAGFSGDVDLWMQAQFATSGNTIDPNSQTFCNDSPIPGTPCTANGAPSGKPPALFRAYINLEHGVRPGESVTIVLPFYTQLAAVTSGNLGKISAQYIDWWNAARVFFYADATAIDGAYRYNVDQNGNIIPPTSIQPISGAAVPTCAPGNQFTCDPVKIVYYIGGYPTGSIPFQLAEYTFASAEGPPPGGLLAPGAPFMMDLRKTNFNISAVDGIYLPAAMEAMLQDDPVVADREYLGTTEGLSEFTAHLNDFIDKAKPGSKWPYYWPSYFSFQQCGQPPIPCIIPHDQPQNGDSQYPLPSVPSANVVFAESYKVPAPAPPVISSNIEDDEGRSPMLGSLAAGMVNLWNKCTTSSNNTSAVCHKIRTVFDFFSRNYNNTCGFSGSPSTPTMLTQVYGWAQFANCSSPLVKTPGYDTAIVEFCSLQYNYLINTPPDDIFNPYTQLIHGTLNSNAYAFSIDDKAAFKSVPSTDEGTSPGLIISVGGPKGLVYNTQAPLPDSGNFDKYCH